MSFQSPHQAPENAIYIDTHMSPLMLDLAQEALEMRSRAEPLVKNLTRLTDLAIMRARPGNKA